MDDVHFLKTHGTERDHEILLQYHPYQKTIQLPEVLQNVIDVRLKLCHVARPHGHLSQPRTLSYSTDDGGTGTIEIPKGRYSEGDLSQELASLGVTYDSKLGKMINGSARVTFDGNHPRICRMLGLPTTGAHVVEANSPFPHYPQLEAPEAAKVSISALNTFIIPTDMVYIEDQNTLRSTIHPISALKSVDMFVADQDGEEMETSGWFVLQFRVLSMADSTIPTDFRPVISAPGYDVTKGMYGNDDSDSEYPDSYDNGNFY